MENATPASGEPTGAPEAPQETTLLLRFGELTLKSSAVRKRFVSLLKRNLEAAFAREGLDCLIRDDWGHLYIDTGNLERAQAICTRTFGLVSVSPVAVVHSGDLSEVAAASAAYAVRHMPETAKSFAVRPRRTGSHKYSSTELGRECGSAIHAAAAAAGHPLTVNLTTPDYEVEVEVRQSIAYLYARRMPCVGGMPLGSAGRVVCVIREGERESELDARAGWMMMKRGCSPVFAVAGDASTSTPSPFAGKALERALAWAPGARVEVLEDPTDRAAIKAIADRSKAAAATVGTLARDGEVRGPHDLLDGYPTFHPLLAMTDEEIARLPFER